MASVRRSLAQKKDGEKKAPKKEKKNDGKRQFPRHAEKKKERKGKDLEILPGEKKLPWKKREPSKVLSIAPRKEKKGKSLSYRWGRGKG